MPPHKAKISGKRVPKSTVLNEDGSYTWRYTYSRGGIHVASTTTTVKWFDHDYPSKVELFDPKGNLVNSWPMGFGHTPHREIDAAVEAFAESLRGVVG